MRQTCSDYIYHLAKQNPKIVFVGSDLGAGAMRRFQEDFPDRFFMEGISEQYIIGFAAGLAAEGFIPIVNTIATFLTRRCLEQIIVDICLDNLSVILIGNGGGMVYAPLGPTHLAIEDVALMRSLPNMMILSPCDPQNVKSLLDLAIRRNGPSYIRLGPSGAPQIECMPDDVVVGQPDMLRKPRGVLIISTGLTTKLALEASDKLENYNISAGVLNISCLKPLDFNKIIEYLEGVKLIVTVEEHLRNGGLGSIILEELSEKCAQKICVKRIGLPDTFPEGYGDQNYLMMKYGISCGNIINTILGELGSNDLI